MVPGFFIFVPLCVRAWACVLAPALALASAPNIALVFVFSFIFRPTCSCADEDGDVQHHFLCTERVKLEVPAAALPQAPSASLQRMAWGLDAHAGREEAQWQAGAQGRGATHCVGATSQGLSPVPMPQA